MLNNCSTSCNFLPFHQDEPMAGDYLCYNRKTAVNVKTWNADTKHYREPTKACEGGMMVSSNRSILCRVVAINRITYRCSLKMTSTRRVLLTLQLRLLYRQTYRTGITFIKQLKLVRKHFTTKYRGLPWVSTKEGETIEIGRFCKGNNSRFAQTEQAMWYGYCLPGTQWEYLTWMEAIARLRF